jgi:hypothetical protein
MGFLNGLTIARPYHHVERGGGFKRFCNMFGPFYYSARSYDPYAQVLRRLGAGAPLTVLRFAPLARLCPVLGFHALYCVCARFMRRRVRFVEPVTTSLKGKTSRRPNFFVFRPIEVPKEPR